MARNGHNRAILANLLVFQVKDPLSSQQKKKKKDHQPRVGGAEVKNPPADAGDVRDTGSVPRSGRYPGVGNGNPLQYSCWENPTDRGAWQVIVDGIAKESDTTERMNTHTHQC